MKRLVAVAIAAAFLVIGAARLYDEPFRPQFHFSPAKNWMNDPNGLVFYQGEYHLFYQYNPFGDQWGHMSWGHAVSPDMVHWQHLPVALAEEKGTMIFSGSTVADTNNSSGLCSGKSCLVAIYTGHTPERQTQNIAVSNDRGRTWTKYKGNPVIDLGMKDFRDPKVFWHEPAKRWIMVVALPNDHKVCFFASTDLKHWNALSDFGPAGATGGQWECPDLFPLPVVGDAHRLLWVLSININPGALRGGSGNQYFVGNFDGRSFTNSNPASTTLWADFGKDFYASTSFNGMPGADGRRIWIGWFSNWLYAKSEPTSPWLSIQTIPRVLKLINSSGRLRLAQQPIVELEKLRAGAIQLGKSSVGDANRELRRFAGESYEIVAEFETGGASEIGFKLRKGLADETLGGYTMQPPEAFIDRTHSGITGFSPDFPGRHVGPLPTAGGRVRLHIFVDRSSVELFVGDGETVISDRIFPHGGSDRLELYSKGAGATLVSATVWKLNTSWR